MKKILLAVIIVLCVVNIYAMEEEYLSEELEHKTQAAPATQQQASGTPQRATRELNLQSAQPIATPQRATRELNLQASQAQQASAAPERATRELKIQR